MHRLLVVDIARLDAEKIVEILGGVDRVTHPPYIADIELLALVNLYVDAEGLVVDNVDRVANDGGITVAARVVEVEQQLLICLVVLLVELSILEEEDALLVCLLEGTAQALILERVVTREVNLTNTHLRATVDDKGDIYTLLIDCIVSKAHIDLAGAEALRGIVLLDELHILIDNVVRELGITTQLKDLIT